MRAQQIRTAALFSILGLMNVGCAGVREVRYVYQDGQSGVIGLPENTSRWPTYYRDHAEELMRKHFPEGYEIVRAEEVEEGERTVTTKGTNSAELDPGLSNSLLVGKLGLSKSRSQSDSVKIKECRIVYKKAGPGAITLHGDYAEQVGWSPPPYVDPNAPARKSEAAEKGPDRVSKRPAAEKHGEEKARDADKEGVVRAA
jgi:hypothetical protein